MSCNPINRSPQIIRPPQVDDVWYVKLHHQACTQELDTALVVELTRETVKLVLIDLEPRNGEPQWGRFKTTDVVWVELVRVMPRVVVGDPSCPTNPSVATVRHLGPKHPDKPPHSALSPEPPPMPK